MDILFIYPAESEGFEPPVRRNAYTAFRVRHFRPLSQLSFALAFGTLGHRQNHRFIRVLVTSALKSKYRLR